MKKSTDRNGFHKHRNDKVFYNVCFSYLKNSNFGRKKCLFIREKIYSSNVF